MENLKSVSLFLAYVCKQGHGVYRSVRFISWAFCN